MPMDSRTAPTMRAPASYKMNCVQIFLRNPKSMVKRSRKGTDGLVRVLVEKRILNIAPTNARTRLERIPRGGAHEHSAKRTHGHPCRYGATKCFAIRPGFGH